MTKIEPIYLTETLTDAFERFFNFSPDMVCFVSIDDCYFKKINREWERVLGYTKDELLAKPFTEFIHLDDREATFKEVERQMNGNATIHFVNRYRAKNGSYRWFDWNASPSLNGNILYAVARDITEQRKAEETARMSEEKYRALVDNSPDLIIRYDCTNRILFANRPIREELRQLLNIEEHEYIGKTFRELGLPADQCALWEQDIQKIVKTASPFSKEYSYETTRGSKIAGKLEFEKIAFKLNELINELDMLFDPVAFNKGIVLDMHIEDNVPNILIGDSFRLRQILSNLIGNALKFTIKGRIDLVIRKVSEYGTQEIKLEFLVKDTGIGISQYKNNEIFKSFSQADSSTTRKYGGTGLGLAICKRLVEKMKGEIWVESKEDEGSSFYFTCVFDNFDEKNYTEVREDLNLKIVQSKMH